jgi:CheY-like chemotaxis protein
MQIGVDSQRAVENKRVFVVDDDDVVGTALQFMLADEMETHVFADLASALTVAAATPPDLVLLGAGLLAGDAVTRLRAVLPQVRIRRCPSGARGRRTEHAAASAQGRERPAQGRRPARPARGAGNPGRHPLRAWR